MAFLRVLVDPDDDLALSRIANVPPRGLSAQALQAARGRAQEQGHSLWHELRATRDAGKLSAAAAGGVAALERLIALRQSPPPVEPGQTRAGAVLRGLLAAAGYQQHLGKEYEEDPNEAIQRWDCCEEVANALDQHERAHGAGKELAALVRGFLDDFVLQVEEENRFQDDKPKAGAVRLMTLHAAKGLEFDCVWMVGMEEGLLPHRRSIDDGLQALDEERRLCYVGVTRAKRRLVLSLCLTRSKWGKSKPSKPSRFLYELTGQAEKFNPEPTQPAASPAARGRAAKRGR
jgi:DNA helicase-2/ATP-dependent DNA helicase PcrA